MAENKFFARRVEALPIVGRSRNQETEEAIESGTQELRLDESGNKKVKVSDPLPELLSSRWMLSLDSCAFCAGFRRNVEPQF